MSNAYQEASDLPSRIEEPGPVRQLNAMDSMFLYMDAPNVPTVLGLLLIYAPLPDEDADARFQRLTRHYQRCINSLPGYRRVIVRAPFEIDNAWFVDGVDLDISHHVLRHRLPAPGNSAQLGEEYAKLFSEQMDTRRPLWEFHVFDGVDAVDGVPEGSFAVIYKFHHSTFDGGTVHRLVEQLHSTSPARDNAPPAPYKSIAVPPPPSLPAALTSSVARVGRFAVGIGKLIGSRLSKRRSTSSGTSGDRGKEAKQAGPVPRTIFNNVDTAGKRHFAYMSLNFAHIKEIREAVPGMTVNDVYHAVLGGAVRRYLAARDALPEHTLVTICTVSTRAEGDEEKGGNAASGMRLPLATDEPDPLRRLHIIHDASIIAKASVKGKGDTEPSAGSDLMANIPARLVATTFSLMRLIRFTSWMPAKFNVITVNVPGPAQTLYLDGSELIEFAGAPPVMLGAGLMVKATSYNKALKIAIHATVDAVPDIGVLLKYMEDSFAELREAVN